MYFRRITYSIFIAAFFIIAPILIMYASGYRYNFKKNKIEKTGILYVDSRPRQSLIYIDGKYRDKTPARFRYMLPDTYRIKVEKEGYHTWEKDLEIKSNLTTFSKDTILFKKSLPMNIISGEINIFTVSPDKTKMIYSIISESGEELRIFNLKNQLDLLIEKFSPNSYSQIDFIQWSPKQNKAIINQKISEFNKFIIVDVETLKTRELFDITRLNFNELKWDNRDENYLYGLREAVLYQIDMISNSVKPIISGRIQDFQVNNNILLLMEIINEESFVSRVAINEKNPEKIQKIKLPSTEFGLYPESRDYLILIDQNNNDFFILKDNSFSEENIERSIILQDRAKKFVWSDDAKKILYNTDFEISIFNFETAHKDLVTRYSGTIIQAAWHPENNYLIYQTENKIKAIEADGQEYKNDIQIAELQSVLGIIIDNQGKNIYFKGQAGTQQGIYRLEIQ